MAELKKGDEVEWNTPQGPTRGSVTRKVVAEAHAGGHTAQASRDEPQYEVQSAKTGRKAIHAADALRKV